MGWIVSPTPTHTHTQKSCWSPILQYLWMWHYLEIGSLQMIKLRWGYWGGPNSNMTVSLYKVELWTQRQRHRENAMWRLDLCCQKPRNANNCQLTNRSQEGVMEQIHLHSLQKDPSLPTTSSQASRLPELWSNEFLLFQGTQCVVLCYSNPRKLIHLGTKI